MTKAEKRQWREIAKLFSPSVRATVIACKREFYEIARRDILRKRGDWKPIYRCGLLANLNSKAREAMRLP